MFVYGFRNGGVPKVWLRVFAKNNDAFHAINLLPKGKMWDCAFRRLQRRATNRNRCKEPRKMMTDKELLEAIRGDQMISAITVLLNVAAFGSTPRYEDGSETPNRLIQLGAAKFLHSLHSENNFEDEHAWLLSQIPMRQRYPDQFPDNSEDRIEEAVGRYWDCAYQEGHLNRPDGDKANQILHEIRCAVQELVAAEREACAKIAGRMFIRDTENYPGAIAEAIRLRSNPESTNAGGIREETNIYRTSVMAYGARFAGHPGFGAVCVDKPEFANETANSLAGWIKQGATIERVSLQAARDGIGEYLAACGPSFPVP